MAQSRKGKSKIKWYLFGLLCILVILIIAWILVAKLENEKPGLNVTGQSGFIGLSQEFSVEVSDQKSGIKKVWAGLLKDGKETLLLEEDFPAVSFMKGSDIHKKTFKIVFEPRKEGITDGHAILRIAVRDSSWRDGFKGNKTYKEIELIVDTKPPLVDILTRQHNITQGGAGLVIYKVSEKGAKSGVAVGENFFPGLSGCFDDENIFIAFFALGYRQSKGTQIYVNAVDQAGNNARAGFYHYIRKRELKKDVINISDRFLTWKMPEFDDQEVQSSQASLIEKFVLVNSKVRKENISQITKPGERTDNILYWDGPFLRLPKSATKAIFAEHRTYKYKGRVVDEQDHLGVDLASTSFSPVPAANKGKVALIGAVGIFGKSIVIDHGFGLFSLYSHLSSIDVAEGQAVLKGEIIGRTGDTGLAGGDHLHYGMFINNTFVNPLEWWDAAWIKNNITNKISMIKEQ